VRLGGIDFQSTASAVGVVVVIVAILAEGAAAANYFSVQQLHHKKARLPLGPFAPGAGWRMMTSAITMPCLSIAWFNCTPKWAPWMSPVRYRPVRDTSLIRLVVQSSKKVSLVIA